VERFGKRDMPAKRFLGIAATAKAPGHCALPEREIGNAD